MPRMPTTPPQLRLPISLPELVVAEAVGEQVAVGGGELVHQADHRAVSRVSPDRASGSLLRAMPIMAISRRRRSMSIGETLPPPLPRTSMMSAFFAQLRVEVLGELVQAGRLHVGDVQVADLAVGGVARPS